MDDEFLQGRLGERQSRNAMRDLRLTQGMVDFCSNDYLGLARRTLPPENWQTLRQGSSGSRLLAGNYPLIEKAESEIAAFHGADSALIFNSGYDANLGLFSCVPRRGDTILYDYLSHASIRDGIRLSNAQSIFFQHNNLDDVEKKLKSAQGRIFLATESVFSMDGDMAPLARLVDLARRFGALLIVDEAHATGVLGRQGEGLLQSLGLEGDCFARIHTFGKGLGCHGAAILGSASLRRYLINFCRPFIYTTALPEISVETIREAYRRFPGMVTERESLAALVKRFQEAELPLEKLPSSTPIQAVILPGNARVKAMASGLADRGLDVRPILYPTVPEGRERLRIVLHSFNTVGELDRLVECLGAEK
jgi:8-amino-7-oxononanoate synthase